MLHCVCAASPSRPVSLFHHHHHHHHDRHQTSLALPPSRTGPTVDASRHRLSAIRAKEADHVVRRRVAAAANVVFSATV